MKWLILFLFPLALFACDPFFTFFAPPEGWLISDPSKYEKGVKASFIASKRQVFTPSLTLSTEKVGSATIEDYTHSLEKIYRRDIFQKLGTFETEAGTAHLFQIDRKTQWGNIRILQAIVFHEGFALLQTGACLKEDYLDFHESYLKAFKTLRTTPSIVESTSHPELKKKVGGLMRSWKKLCATSKDAPEILFASAFFQNNQWKPFVNFVENALESEGTCWQFLALKHIQETLLSESDK